MAIIRLKEMRELEDEALDRRMRELKNELNGELGVVAAGGKAANAGRIREIRRTIARILTIKKERLKTAAKGAA